jgi:hypothetical protein
VKSHRHHSSLGDILIITKQLDHRVIRIAIPLWHDLVKPHVFQERIGYNRSEYRDQLQSYFPSKD